ncbi:MAG: RHS repeat domain-containing protein [Solirubrobacteraceae bacterium]|nr:RHS repeat domain-containing protein [Solirubrobacteraceae bacterium]
MDGSGIPSSYSRATVHYLNGGGREVNVASPGGHIMTREYDEHHNVVRSLTAANRERALTAGDTPARAREIDTVSSYDATGLELREQWEPQHEITLPSLQVVQARRHTVTTYESDGSHLPTTVRVGAEVVGQSTDAEERTTSYDYDATGKTLRKPTTTVVDPDGLKLATKVAYDPGTGLEVSRTLPAGNANGSDAGTTRTIYYTAGTNTQDSACGDKPAWANLVCKIAPAAQPTSIPPSGTLPPIPTSTYEYDRLSNVTTRVDAEGSASRTTSYGYDASGRLLTETITATSGQALPTVTHGYSSSTGRATTLSTSSPAQTITRVHDSIGRETQHTDADDVTTTTYDLLDRPTTIDDGKAVQTFGYDPVRGMLTSVSDPQVGVLGGTYDADGAIATKTYPNGLTATTTTNEAGAPTKLHYVKASNCGASCDWLLSQVEIGIHGQQVSQMTTTQTGEHSADSYTYDAAGRLTLNGDITGNPSACTVIGHQYDPNSNRKQVETRGPGPSGECRDAGESTVQTTSHDEADRITTSGFDYDAFGRTLTVPAAHAGGSELTSTYYTNDLARSITQSGLTRTYSLDQPGACAYVPRAGLRPRRRPTTTRAPRTTGSTAQPGSPRTRPAVHTPGTSPASTAISPPSATPAGLACNSSTCTGTSWPTHRPIP